MLGLEELLGRLETPGQERLAGSVNYWTGIYYKKTLNKRLGIKVNKN